MSDPLKFLSLPICFSVKKTIPTKNFFFLVDKLIKPFWFSPWPKKHGHKQTRSDSANTDVP